MKRGKRRVKKLRRGVSVAATCMMCLTAACSLPWPWNHPTGQCNLKDCNVNLVDLESKIDESTRNQIISSDQADARKAALRVEWAKYKSNAIPCKDFLEKAAYLICP